MMLATLSQWQQPDLPLDLQPPPLPLLCRMDEDGLCSLRLRAPCEWDGVVFEAVTAVKPMPLLSGDWGSAELRAACMLVCASLAVDS